MILRCSLPHRAERPTKPPTQMSAIPMRKTAICTKPAWLGTDQENEQPNGHRDQAKANSEIGYTESGLAVHQGKFLRRNLNQFPPRTFSASASLYPRATKADPIFWRSAIESSSGGIDCRPKPPSKSEP